MQQKETVVHVPLYKLTVKDRLIMIWDILNSFFGDKTVIIFKGHRYGEKADGAGKSQESKG